MWHSSRQRDLIKKDLPDVELRREKIFLYLSRLVKVGPTLFFFFFFFFFFVFVDSGEISVV